MEWDRVARREVRGPLAGIVVWIKRVGGILLAAALLSRPEAAVNGAREAMAQWYYAVAPSIFPFMALMPLLTCDEALAFYEDALGGAMRRLYRLPGAAASTMVVGMLAGSPAGCAAARRVAVRSEMDSAQLTRLCAACCGMSPGFLVTGVGATMLGSAAYGRLLLGSQIAAQLILPAVLRLLPSRGHRVPERVDAAGDARPMRDAVLAILAVCGYMALFGALARVARQFVGRTAGDALASVMDVSTGAGIVSGLDADIGARLVALSALAGFGGVCVCLQNLSAIEGCGISRGTFFALRLAAAGLNALLTLGQMQIGVWMPARFAVDPLRLSCLCACIVALPALRRLKRTIS